MAWLGTWKYRIPFFIPLTYVASFSTDIQTNGLSIPLPIFISSTAGKYNEDISAVFDELPSSSLSDRIAVTLSDGTTECNVEVEFWDVENEIAKIWISVEDYHGSEFYLYFDQNHAANDGNVGEIGSDAGQAVWTPIGAKGVWHLSQEPDGTGSILDSSYYENHGTPTSVTSEEGRFGNVLEFNGSGYITIPYDASIDDMEDKTIVISFNMSSYDNLPRLLDKTKWYVDVQTGSGVYKCRYYHDYTTTDGVWKTASSFSTGSWNTVFLTSIPSYLMSEASLNSDQYSENYSIYPSGTPVSDALCDLSIGYNRYDTNRFFVGNIEEVWLLPGYKTIQDTAQILIHDGLADNLLNYSSEEYFAGATASNTHHDLVTSSVSISTAHMLDMDDAYHSMASDNMGWYEPPTDADDSYCGQYSSSFVVNLDVLTDSSYHVDSASGSLLLTQKHYLTVGDCYDINDSYSYSGPDGGRTEYESNYHIVLMLSRPLLTNDCFHITSPENIVLYPRISSPEGDISVTAPSFTVSAHGGGHLALVSQVFTVSATGIVDSFGDLETDIPSMSIEMVGGGQIVLDVPSFDVSVSGAYDVYGDLSVTVDVFSVDVCSVNGAVGDISVIASPFTLDLVAYQNPIASVEMSSGVFSVAMVGYSGLTGDIEIEIGLIECDITGIADLIGSMSVDFDMDAMIECSIADRFRRYTMRYGA
jgi:hypothetical protein